MLPGLTFLLGEIWPRILDIGAACRAANQLTVYDDQLSFGVAARTDFSVGGSLAPY